jgi:hypothetical protein
VGDKRERFARRPDGPELTSAIPVPEGNRLRALILLIFFAGNSGLETRTGRQILPPGKFFEASA